ncbi:hypothetical protein Q1W73_12630 [Asticcacaulis sp. ZE23SCel15]|nr:hypothetical protein [Asticcacaulis sp. ZE23SCel15]WKL56526.1 hypothetical protein Q1W73_12630 [Asticcacaulis sp. ZE23SCel15]
MLHGLILVFVFFLFVFFLVVAIRDSGSNDGAGGFNGRARNPYRRADDGTGYRNGDTALK